MTALSTKSRALAASVCRTPSTRLVHSSSVAQASALTATQLNQEIEEITLQPIFDIFDAPSRLADSREFIREKYTSASTSSRSNSVVASRQGQSSPAPLPPPVTFEGPAHPRNAALALKARMRQAGLAPSQKKSISTSSTGSSRPFTSSSEPIIEIFNGPARITRYHHSPSGSGNTGSTTKLAVALGVAGTVGYAALATDASPWQL